MVPEIVGGIDGCTVVESFSACSVSLAESSTILSLDGNRRRGAVAAPGPAGGSISFSWTANVFYNVLF